MKSPTIVEKTIDRQANRILQQMPSHGIVGALIEFLVFGLKQAWACLFGAAILALIIITRFYYPFENIIGRYDFLFVCAIFLQLTMLIAKLETLAEAKVIFIFHVVGTIMEVFKTHVGSWTYPGDAIFHIGAVPLFSGFMYASIGSYIARIGRIFDIHYAHYPPMWTTLVLCIAIYINFFSHHYLWDMRYILFAITIGLYGKCIANYRVFRFSHKMPLLLGFLLIALFIWLAENIGTFSRAWFYPGQENGWTWVSPAKLGSWYLLMIISFVLVTLVHRPKSPDEE
ncbi:MAG: DUF817 domain-containing protein [Hyphomicrobiales bacterium]|nr:DUF817 domain-containing protein [Hyphomicrobiales bacterium]